MYQQEPAVSDQEPAVVNEMARRPAVKVGQSEPAVDNEMARRPVEHEMVRRPAVISVGADCW